MDVELHPSVLGRLHQALSTAFTDWGQLKSFTFSRLGLALEKELSGPGEPLSTILFNLVERMQAEGRLVQLIRQARRLNPGNEPLKVFEREWLPPITTEQLVKLETLVGVLSLSGGVLMELAERCAPPGWSLVQPTPQEPAHSTFARIIDTLSSAQLQADGTHPLHRFIRMLADEMPGRAGALHAWIGESSGGQVLLGPGRARRSLRSLHLFVKCDPGTRPAPVQPGDEVFVKAWLWFIGEDAQPVSRLPKLVLDCMSCPLSKLPELLTRLLMDAKVSGPLREARGQMTIEVCLPHVLLLEDVERWQITFGTTQVRLGLKYPVVVRSFERLYHGLRRVTWGDWADKWDQLKQHQGVPGESSVVWIRPDETGDELPERLMQPHVLCIISPLGCGPESLSVGVDAGIPAMLCLRAEGAADSEVGDCLGPLLSGPLAELPARVHEARRLMKEGPASHITLLWDDYDRLPPDADDDSVLCAPLVA
jgi:hypothetical protein